MTYFVNYFQPNNIFNSKESNLVDKLSDEMNDNSINGKFKLLI